jgi:nicotinate-nucleotide adenylyltransferase
VRIALLGGSFDPVHAGHVSLAEAARDRLGADRVLLVVAAGQPLKPGGAAAPQPHTPGGPAPRPEDRYAMVRLAVRGRPRIEASDLELHRPPPSYTVDTLRELRRGLPADTEVLLLLGADALSELPRWREAAEVRRLAKIVGCGRPGFPPPAGADLALEAATPDVSSTDVRRRVRAGEPIEGLVPGDVAAYIEERGLYRA